MGVIRATSGSIYEVGDTEDVVPMIRAMVDIIKTAEVGDLFDAVIHCDLSYGDVLVGDPLGKFIGKFGQGAFRFLVIVNVPAEKAFWGLRE